MPRVHFVKRANKPHGDAIKKGDSYYWWKFRYGGRHVSKTQPRRSDLTQSKMSTIYAALESVEDVALEVREDIQELIDTMESANESVEEVASEYEEAAEEMGAAGEQYTERADEIRDNIGGGIESAISELQELVDDEDGDRILDDDLMTAEGLQSEVCELDV